MLMSTRKATTMTMTFPRRLTQALIASLAVYAAAAATVSSAQAEQPARYMQRVVNELVAASRQGSTVAFAKVMRRHADLPTIGLYSLGSYGRSLRRADRKSYFAGMIAFIARYAAKEAPKYPVSKGIVLGQTEETKAGIYVDSVIKMSTGTSYDVRWWLVRRGGSYKVADAQVLGFWARESLKSLFENYITENGGSPRALVVALNR